MVALANLAIGVSEHAYGIIVSNEDVQRGEKSEETGDVSKALLIDVKTIEAYEFIRKHSLELGLAWYERAAPHKDALFNMGQVNRYQIKFIYLSDDCVYCSLDVLQWSRWL